MQHIQYVRLLFRKAPETGLYSGKLDIILGRAWKGLWSLAAVHTWGVTTYDGECSSCVYSPLFPVQVTGGTIAPGSPQPLPFPRHTRTSQTANLWQDSADTQGHFNVTIDTLAYSFDWGNPACWPFGATMRSYFVNTGRNGGWYYVNEHDRPDDVSLRVIFTCRTPSSAEGPNSRGRKGNRLLTFHPFTPIMAFSTFINSVSGGRWKKRKTRYW